MTEALVIAAVAALVLVPSLLGWRSRRRRIEALRAAARNWPAVEGRITASALQDVTRHESSLAVRAQRAVVWYEYFVGGRRYSNNVVDIADLILSEGRPAGSGSSESPRVLAERYPEGAVVPVYVDPADPHRSCLER
jgi:hypothetical protein